MIELAAASRAEAVERWQGLHDALCDVLHGMTQQNLCDDTFHHLPDLLAELMPEWDDARKMAK